MKYLYFLFTVTIRFARDCMDVFAHISLCASVLMVVALTFERHYAITSPHQVIDMKSE